MSLRARLVAVACFATVAAGMAPTDLVRVRQQGPAAVWIAPAPGKDGRLSVRLSAIVTIKVTVEGRQPLEVEPVKRITDSAAWKVVKVLAPSLVSLDANQARWEQSYQLMPLDKGDQPLSLTPLKFRTANGHWQTVAWQPIPATVTSIIKRIDAGETSDITDIEHLPTPVRWWQRLVWPGLAVLVAVIGGTAWLVVRRWRQSAASLPPDQAALRELDHLMTRSLPQAGRGARFCFLVASIVRRYLERRFNLPVQRQTTAEFLAAMHHAPPLAVPDQELLRDLLERCDLAKFAGVAPSPSECDELAARARRLIAQTASPPTHKAARDG
jgi:Domain of unknown function (DUF4381)